MTISLYALTGETFPVGTPPSTALDAFRKLLPADAIIVQVGYKPGRTADGRFLSVYTVDGADGCIIIRQDRHHTMLWTSDRTAAWWCKRNHIPQV